LAGKALRLLQDRDQGVLHGVFGQRFIPKLQLCKTHKLGPHGFQLAVEGKGVGCHLPISLTDQELKYNKMAL
jgi:hypothetical protein